MTEHPSPQSAPPIPDAWILDLDGIQARDGIGKTKAAELVRGPGFPNTVVPGMHRYPLEALEAWEHTTALAGTVAAATPFVVGPPAPRRPGRKPAATKAVA